MEQHIGLICRGINNIYTVEEKGVSYLCRIKGKQLSQVIEEYNPLAVGDIQGLIRKLRDRGIGVLISDHNVRETLTICDRAYLVHQGQVILDGTPEHIVGDEQARLVYLGADFCL